MKNGKSSDNPQRGKDSGDETALNVPSRRKPSVASRLASKETRLDVSSGQPFKGAAPEHTNCIFCKISAKEIPSNIVLEGDDFVAFRDINPQAPTHILIVPKNHYDNLAKAEDAAELGRLFMVAKQLAEMEKLKGFRVVVNNGRESGQTVDHLHIHVLGGRFLKWPPG